MPLPDATRRRWAAAGNKSEQVAAWLAAWAASQGPGDIVPADDVIIARFPGITMPVTGRASPNDPRTVHRAIRLLAGHRVLYRDPATGHYHVAAPTAPPDGAP